MQSTKRATQPRPNIVRRAALTGLTVAALLAPACRDDDEPPDRFNTNLGAATQPLMPTTLPTFDAAVSNARADDIVKLTNLDAAPPDEVDAVEPNGDALDGDGSYNESKSVANFVAALESADPAPAFAERVIAFLDNDSEFTLDDATTQALADAGAILTDDSLSAEERDQQLADALKSIGITLDEPADDSGG